jgi:hypothetical protein
MLTLTILKSGWGPWVMCWRLVPMWHKLIMEERNFGRLAVCVLSPDWLSRKGDFCQALRWSRRAWGGECGPCTNFASYTQTFALQLRKITENLSQANRKALGWSAPNAIRLVDGLDWPVGTCRPWLMRQATGFQLNRRLGPPTHRESNPESSRTWFSNQRRPGYIMRAAPHL